MILGYLCSRISMWSAALLLMCVSAWANLAHADTQFVTRAFPEGEPLLSTFWLNTEVKNQLKKDFDYQLNRLRLRYWQQGPRSAWVLEEVGKEQPITVGVVVEAQRIQSVEVLVYRESRGGEVQYPFFLEQFLGAELQKKGKRLRLSQRIDGITGATLSVRALEKIAKVALFLDASVNTPSVNEQI